MILLSKALYHWTAFPDCFFCRKNTTLCWYSILPARDRTNCGLLGFDVQPVLFSLPPDCRPPSTILACAIIVAAVTGLPGRT